jgi:hypothetical protein
MRRALLVIDAGQDGNAAFPGEPRLGDWVDARGIRAAELSRVTAANLDGEFSGVVTTDDVTG